MSSTNRSNAREEHIADYYVTPINPVMDFLKEFQKDESINLSSQKHMILDPCAGGDEKHDMTYPHCLFSEGADYNKIITNDIREDSGAKYHKDFTQITQENIYDIVITNPPFGIAQQIIEKALQTCRGGGLCYHAAKIELHLKSMKASILEEA